MEYINMTSQKMKDIFLTKSHVYDVCSQVVFKNHTHTFPVFALKLDKAYNIYLNIWMSAIIWKKQLEHMGPWNYIPTGLQSARTELWQLFLTGPVPPYHHSPSLSLLFLLEFIVVFHLPTCPITIYIFIALSMNFLRSFLSFNMFDSWNFWLRHWNLWFYAFFSW